MERDTDTQLTISKWPFYLGDVLLVGVAITIGSLSNWELTDLQVAYCVVAIALGSGLLFYLTVSSIVCVTVNSQRTVIVSYEYLCASCSRSNRLILCRQSKFRSSVIRSAREQIQSNTAALDQSSRNYRMPSERFRRNDQSQARAYQLSKGNQSIRCRC